MTAWLVAGPEECSPGGSELSSMEGTELPGAQALAVPGAEHPAHDGPGRAANTESRLAGKRGRGYQGRPPGQRRRQRLSFIRTEWTWNESTHTWDSFTPFFLLKKSYKNNCCALLGKQSWVFTPSQPQPPVEGTKPVSSVWIASVGTFLCHSSSTTFPLVSLTEPLLLFESCSYVKAHFISESEVYKSTSRLFTVV